MHRTYKSKKDTGGGLDPREVLVSLDDKSSAFDAFYIRNIKQTKRELSCMGTTNQNKAAVNRVRKRKYVRRIVREVERQLEDTMSKSAYLTPDKSLHVNKGHDLFDQLLKASPEPLQPHKTDRDNMFDQLRLSTEKNTYGRKMLMKSRMKKLNYSSSDSSDHGKENMTDLGKHELVIEKVTKTSPDDSINQIVSNISAINKIIKRKRQSQSFKGSSRKNKNNLTENLPLDIGNSPLCSTPFVEKYRGKSIYRLSPIPIGNLDDSDKSNEVKTNTILHDLGEFANNIELNLPENVHDKPSQSPVLTFKSSQFTNSSGSLKIMQKTAKHSPKDNQTGETEIREEITKVVAMDEKRQNENIKNSIIIQTNVENISFKSLTKTSFNESIKITEDLQDNNDYDQGMFTVLPSRKSVILNSNVSYLVKKTQNITQELTQKVHVSDDIFAEDQSSTEKDMPVEASVELEPLLGFTESAIQNNTEVITIDESEVSIHSSDLEITMVDVLPETDVKKADVLDNLSSSNENSADQSQVNSANESNSEDSIANETNPRSDSETTESDEDFNSINSDKDDSNAVNEDEGDMSNSVRQSLYNTCDSIESENEPSLSETKEFKHQQPIVVLDRISDFTFKKYYHTLSDSSDSIESENEPSLSETKEFKHQQPNVVLDRISDSTFKKYYHTLSDSNSSKDNSSIKDCNHSSLEEPTCNDQNNSKEELNELQTTNEDSNSEETDSEESNEEEEEKHISFVTTRRRQEIGDETLMMILDASNNSGSSSEGNKTVLNNHGVENMLKDTVDSKENKLSLPIDRNSLTIRRDSRPLRESTINSKLDITEVKALVVLQPGKKWERSLSIYRRMTMQSDLEQSIAEDEQLVRKGRNYRQSVIHTMELQDSYGPLHNDSFSSHRSSVLSKPHRSTIRLAKEPNDSRISLYTTAVFDDLTEFLHDDCDDTVIELSKLSIGDAHEITVVENQDSSVRGTTAKDFVLRRCNQTAPILFDECYPDSVLKNCHKIGEGVYGEVFLWRARDGHARVMKVVPIAGSIKVNGEHQKDFHEIISEIVIAMELSALRAPIADIESHFDEGKDADTLDLHTIENATDGFNEVIAVRCVQGAYPSRLLDLWDLYDECKGSENDNPAALPDDQQYVVLELANAGQDLEGYQFNNAEQAHALFLQVAFTLAVGEESFQFEHRDLHWGNVLIAPTEQKYATFVLRGRAHRTPRCGVAATIIDYSLSRLSLPLGGERASLFNDLATDDGLFDAVGDYQFEVYRLMRDKLGNDWKNFEPYTNILWLHYTVDKMITALRYKRTNTKLHKHFIAKLKGIKNRILDYRSATHFVLTDNEL